MPADTPHHIREAYANAYGRNKDTVCTCKKGQAYQWKLTGYFYKNGKWHGNGRVDHGWWDRLAEKLSA
jgi:hypothetical protein